jgi:hypothetical protein
MLAKKHENMQMTVLAICDKEIIGKTFEEGNLSVTAKERFYKGEEITEKEFDVLVREASSLNLLGNKCVGLAVKKNLVDEKSVIVIQGIKHAQIYKL